jgi:SAM-dependent methyltransferase
MIPIVFDRRAVQRHRTRAAAHLDEHGFLFREAASRLAERLDVVRRSFPVALELGAHGAILREAIGARGGIASYIAADLAPAMAARAARPALAADEELLPIAPNSVDLVVSCLSLHWVNDLPGALIQANRILRPDGLFLASLFGRATLADLREALLEAELTDAGGVRPRVSPFVDARDAAGLLQRAGFALPVVDSDTISVRYREPLRLMRDLRLMGEANALVERPRRFTRRATLLGAAARYAQRSADADGRIPAQFEIVTMTAWAPAASQPRALRPGSAAHRLATALGATEQSAGEKTGRR